MVRKTNITITLIDNEIRHTKELLHEFKNKLQYYREFIFVKDVTLPPHDNGRYTTIYPRTHIYRHPLSKEECINVDLIIPKLEDRVKIYQHALEISMNNSRYNFYGKLEKINFLL